MSDSEKVRDVLDYVDEGIPEELMDYYVVCQCDGRGFGESETALIALNSDLEKAGNKFHIIFTGKNSAVTSKELTDLPGAMWVYELVRDIMEVAG